jgi:hypothetical protein
MQTSNNCKELEDFLKEWKELSSNYSHLLEDNKHFHATYFSASKSNLKIVNNSTHEKTARIKIMFKDGTTIPAENTVVPANKVLCEFIEKVGANKVYKAHVLAVGKHELVTKDLASISRYEPYSAGNGWYVITKTATSEKVKQINEIIQKLGIKANVEYIKD